MLTWCLAHPWMTFFIIWIISNDIRYSIKYITKYYDSPEDIEECPHGYKDWDDCPDCSH